MPLLHRLQALVYTAQSASALLARPSLVAAQDTAAPSPPLPAAAFARLPQFSHLSLSPDGLHIAALMNLDDTSGLVVRALHGKTPRGVLRAPTTSASISTGRDGSATSACSPACASRTGATLSARWRPA